MAARPLVSVIMPCLNAKRFIEEAIESVLAQTFNGWELAIVDDGSTDGSQGIARSYAARHPARISYFEHEGNQHLGASASRNVGIRRTSAEYIALLDADDVWLPQKLEQQMHILETNGTAGMLYGNTLYWYSWTGRPEDTMRDYLPRRSHRHAVLSPPALLKQYLSGETAVPCTCSVLMRRAVVERVDGFENAFRGLYDDQVLYAKMVLAAPVIVINQCWDKYRQNPDSCCSRAVGSSSRGARLEYLGWLTRYLKNQEVSDPQVWRALEQAQWRTRYPRFARLTARARRMLDGVHTTWR